MYHPIIDGKIYKLANRNEIKTTAGSTKTIEKTITNSKLDTHEDGVNST